MVKSRQIGISLSTAYDLVLKTGKRSCRLDTWVSSRDEFQAQVFAAKYVNPNHIYAQLI